MILTSVRMERKTPFGVVEMRVPTGATGARCALLGMQPRQAGQLQPVDGAPGPVSADLLSGDTRVEGFLLNSQQGSWVGVRG